METITKEKENSLKAADRAFMGMLGGLALSVASVTGGLILDNQAMGELEKTAINYSIKPKELENLRNLSPYYTAIEMERIANLMPTKEVKDECLSLKDKYSIGAGLWIFGLIGPLISLMGGVAYAVYKAPNKAPDGDTLFIINGPL